MKRETDYFPFINIPVADELLIARSMSCSHYGLFTKMRIEMWYNNQFGTFPKDDSEIAKICNCRKQLVTQARPKIDKYLTETESGLSDNTLIHTYAYVVEKQQNLRVSGRMGGLATQQKKKQMLQGGLSKPEPESNLKKESYIEPTNTSGSSIDDVEFEKELVDANTYTVEKKILPFILCREKVDLHLAVAELCKIEREGEEVPSATDLVGKYNQYVEKIKDSNGGYDTFAKAFHKWLQVKGYLGAPKYEEPNALPYREAW